MNLRELAKRHLPYPAKQGFKYIYGAIPSRFRYDKVFWETYNFLQESQWWSGEKLQEYQVQQLEKLLKHAYENVSYYRKVFDKRGLKPKNIRDFDDLRKLPCLTREIIQENLPDLLARNYPRSKLEYVTTGGSTGIPLGFYHEKGVSEAKERAFIIMLWNRVGFKIGDRCVILRGDVVQLACKGKFWKYDPLKKNLILSSYHMTDEILPNYIGKIRKFRPDFIQAYPSAITILARFMKKDNIEPFPTVKAILCASENLYTWQRELLEEVMKCRIWSFYGHSERAALAGECEVSTYYHIFPEYGYLELIGSDGNEVTRDRETGEIVATGFNNFICPFIRYRTMDLAVALNTKCKCGRNYPLLKRIEGRLQEFFVDKTGSLITFTCSHKALWNVKEKINAYQYVQNEPGKVLLNIDAKSKFSISDIDSVKRTFLHLYPRLNIEIKFVHYIPRTKSGKFRFLVQKLPIEFG
ncbi:phenylacetate--CoA ligase family protein, partial [Candidatus Aerophobetes bacterium]|nr:phenylacetate--CoA ligase family protein [Candidatus Aerophobetes bacterium]